MCPVGRGAWGLERGARGVVANEQVCVLLTRVCVGECARRVCCGVSVMSHSLTHVSLQYTGTACCYIRLVVLQLWAACALHPLSEE